MTLKTIIFSLITFLSSVCYGQLPYGSDRVIVLVMGPVNCTLSQAANKNFTNNDVRQYMKTEDVQFIRVFGEDYDAKWHRENRITYYPAILYYVKDGDKYRLSRTVSGADASKLLGVEKQVRHLLGMTPKAPVIPSPKIPPQYVAPQQSQPQYTQSAPSS